MDLSKHSFQLNRFIARFRYTASKLTVFYAVFAALLVGAVVISLSGHNVITTYQSLFLGAFGGSQRVSEVLVKTIPLLVMGLAISIAFKNQFWNIGGEGQLLAGAVLSTWAALTFSHLPTFILALICLIVGFIGGGCIGLLAGFLKVRLNVNEVISTLMLNFIALYTMKYLIRGPMMDRTGLFKASELPQSPFIPESLYLPILLSQTRLHAGIILAIIFMILTWLLWRTRIGFEIELTGANQEAARYAGMDVRKTILLASFLSGGLGGLVGWNEIFGIHHRLLEGLTGGYGYLGIVVARLGGLNPFGILVSSVFFSALVVGTRAMERASGVSVSLIDVISGLVILFLLIRASIERTIRGDG